MWSVMRAWHHAFVGFQFKWLEPLCAENVAELNLEAIVLVDDQRANFQLL